MSHLPKPNPKFYADKIASIKTDAAPVLAKIDSGEFTWRDVAIVTEHLQQYADILEEMEDSPPRLKEFTWMT